MNHLKSETSPYLLQHAHNPVNWYPWKEEALALAIKEDKPILLSIGYSACHWCHVMERESFEDEEVAAFMNKHFINIKVDREERPDIDQIYMDACQMLSGSGGWPLNCFLTPDRRPFFAGTYFPPVPAHNRPSWLQVLTNIARTFRGRRAVVEDQAMRLTKMIGGSDGNFIKNDLLEINKDTLFHPDKLRDIFEKLTNQFDLQEGGFGGAPKFPATMSLQFLLAYHFHTGERRALDHVVFSLDRMIGGGIYDQLGGGFARYATDRAWLIPHFEKMLYDNALLVGLLTEAYKVTRKETYRQTIIDTLGFIEREMTAPAGGFYSALDADSEGEEGKFYVWDYSEIASVLGSDTPLFAAYYGLSEEGNWEEKNILWRPFSMEKLEEIFGLSAETIEERISACRQLLFGLRAERVRPALDDKILLGWNALQITAYAKAYSTLGIESYRNIAIGQLEFLLEKMANPEEGGFYHTYKEGKAQYPAFLDDYAFLMEALLAVYPLDFEMKWLEKAKVLADHLLEYFFDPDSGLFYFTAVHQKDVLVRKKELFDSAQPSGNATMAMNLLQLGTIFDNDQYRKVAAEMVAKVSDAVIRYPSSFSKWALAFATQTHGLPEIAVVGPDSFAMANELEKSYLPSRVLMADPKSGNSMPLLIGKTFGSNTNIYICKDYTCLQPVTTIDAALALLKTT